MTEDEWQAWLDEQTADSPGVWLRITKKGCEPPSINYAQALEVAVCFGWIDGQKRSYDASSFLQRFTPRTRTSKWSQVNRDKAQRLITEGRMRPAGLAQVAAAKQDGRWEAAYPPQGSAPVPPDLQTALDAHPKAREFFATLTGSRRYAFLYRLHNVKTPAGRERRIADYIARLSEGRTLD